MKCTHMVEFKTKQIIIKAKHYLLPKKIMNLFVEMDYK